MFITAFLDAGFLVLCLMVVLWLISLTIKNSSIVDIFWGIGFVLIAWLTFALFPEGYLPRKVLSALLVTIWGLRLSIHIFLRNKGKGEDFRYQKWRNEAGSSWWYRSLFKVFLLQGILMWIISLPVVAAQVSPKGPLNILDFFGLAVWIIGFYFEAAGDHQLARFKSNPENKGGVLNSGVWKYSRHPNYFGDAFQWWGFFLLALSAGYWWTVISPVIMTLLLIRVSGVALLEKTLKESKPGYREYVENTSAFIPLPPKKKQ
jgi:steroid 5-alpha reductase family enzyme